jgi:coenzyme F420 biosynthesis associated uncharacterized protein
MASLVDWQLAARTAKALAAPPPLVTADEAAQTVDELRGAALRAGSHVAELTHLQEPAVTAATRVVDRAGWIDVNTQGLGAIIGPLADKLMQDNPPGRIASAVGSRATGAQAGALLAFMSSKVLGQFEFFARPEGQLVLVAPNIVTIERALHVVPRDFRLWVCLHEVTHRVQFTAVPWMREHLIGEIRLLTDELDTDADVWRDRLKDVVATVRARRQAHGAPADGLPTDGTGDGAAGAAGAPVAGADRSGLLGLLATESQREILDRLTGFMSLVEGHAEYVMNAVSADVIPTQRTIERRFGVRRRKGANPVDRLLRSLLGLEAKSRQYVEGSRFVRTVVDQVGLDSFNAVWTSPNTLPTKAEIADPGLWVKRVHG